MAGRQGTVVRDSQPGAAGGVSGSAAQPSSRGVAGRLPREGRSRLRIDDLARLPFLLGLAALIVREFGRSRLQVVEPGIAWLGAGVGLAAAAAHLVWYRRALLSMRRRVPVFLGVGVVAVLGYGTLGGQLLVLVNCLLDGQPPGLRTVEVLYREEHLVTGRHRRTWYTVDVPSWTEDVDSPPPLTLRVSKDVYEQTANSLLVTLTVKPGALGFGWVSRVQSGDAGRAGVEGSAVRERGRVGRVAGAFSLASACCLVGWCYWFAVGAGGVVLAPVESQGTKGVAT
ncbi:MAG: hypothetical protein JXR77_16350 [Lentisphaeria bacterium]|nr:hypothetical protein [Lentisphaeria bacterium]